MFVVGKEILLKVVLQEIPSYAMGGFLLPKTTAARQNTLFKKLWWGYNKDSSKIHWLE